MNKIILALDTPDAHQALKITRKVKDKIYTIKIGSEFYFRFGKEGVKKFNDIGINNIFLDLKIHDIGNTVHKAILALKDINFKYLSVHSLGGNEVGDEEVEPEIYVAAPTNHFLEEIVPLDEPEEAVGQIEAIPEIKKTKKYRALPKKNTVFI